MPLISNHAKETTRVAKGVRGAPGHDKASEIERRDWWTWGYAITVILILTAAVISLALPSVLGAAKPLFKVKLVQALATLVVLVVIFNCYTVYQQVLIKRLRKEIAQTYSVQGTLHRMAMIDSLTGLYNRRFGEERLAAEVHRSERKGHPLTVMLLDLDNFKRVNDQHGHAAGDVVLREFANCLAKAIRGSDLAVRLGGDEFLLILPECTLDQVQHVLNRLGAAEIDLAGEKIPIGFSVGCQQYAFGDGLSDLLRKADGALYLNKRNHKVSQA